MNWTKLIFRHFLKNCQKIFKNSSLKHQQLIRIDGFSSSGCRETILLIQEILFSWVKSYFDAFLGAGPVPGHKILKFAPRAQISKFCFFLPGRCRCRDPRSHANFAVNRVFERYFEGFKLRECHSHLRHDLLYLLNLSDLKKVHSE